MSVDFHQLPREHEADRNSRHRAVVAAGQRLALLRTWRDDPRPASGLLQGVYAFWQ
ncbi:HEXXH motif-containing putative peptide modification protein [Actinoallomurus bryophytorum]|uniref:HEXXH motif-containing putative peptide modification protein n=1 Tax=Actinoallomurus bryophytorum TaxID=1490222 RepID=UPI00114E6387|nr:HEXXH motif-containing putative peptide modification protein [Actinoallomurus bryophytorum]